MCFVTFVCTLGMNDFGYVYLLVAFANGSPLGLFFLVRPAGCMEQKGPSQQAVKGQGVAYLRAKVKLVKSP